MILHLLMLAMMYPMFFAIIASHPFASKLQPFGFGFTLPERTTSSRSSIRRLTTGSTTSSELLATSASFLGLRFTGLPSESMSDHTKNFTARCTTGDC